MLSILFCIEGGFIRVFDDLLQGDCCNAGQLSHEIYLIAFKVHIMNTIIKHFLKQALTNSCHLLLCKLLRFDVVAIL